MTFSPLCPHLLPAAAAAWLSKIKIKPNLQQIVAAAAASWVWNVYFIRLPLCACWIMSARWGGPLECNYFHLDDIRWLATPHLSRPHVTIRHLPPPVMSRRARSHASSLSGRVPQLKINRPADTGGMKIPATSLSGRAEAAGSGERGGATGFSCWVTFWIHTHTHSLRGEKRHLFF